MKKILVILAAVFSVAFASAAFAASDYAEGQVLVVMKNSSNLAHTCSANAAAVRVSAAAALASTVDAKVINIYDALSASSGQVFMHLHSTTKTADEMIAELKKNPNVVAVSKNYRRKLLSNSASTTALQATAASFDQQWGLKKIGAEKAWKTTTGSKEVVVAVIDTGIVYNHPDLKDNMWQDTEGKYGPKGSYGKMFYAHNGSGYITDPDATYTASADITSGDATQYTTCSPEWWGHIGDICGHGTHLAGIIGASGSKTVYGINKKVKLLTVGVGSVAYDDEGDTYHLYGPLDAEQICGINYTAELKQKGVNIVAANISIGDWGTPPEDLESNPYFRALKAASETGNGILFCIAAGNNSEDLENPREQEHEGQLMYPVGFCKELENAISVGASRSDDKRSEKKAIIGGIDGADSNWSSTGKYTDVFAPGELILSACLQNKIDKFYEKDLLYNTENGGYAYASGTSMATPMVTGAAALLAAAYPNKTPAEIKALLTSTAASACRDGFSKYGRIDLAAAMEAGAPEPSSDSSSGGGCNAGFAGLALVGAAALAVLKKKH